MTEVAAETRRDGEKPFNYDDIKVDDHFPKDDEDPNQVYENIQDQIFSKMQQEKKEEAERKKKEKALKAQQDEIKRKQKEEYDK